MVKQITQVLLKGWEESLHTSNDRSKQQHNRKDIIHSWPIDDESNKDGDKKKRIIKEKKDFVKGELQKITTTVESSKENIIIIGRVVT